MRCFAEDELRMSKTCFSKAAIFRLCETVNRHKFFLWVSEGFQSLPEQIRETPNIKFVKISWTDSRLVARLLATLDNTDIEGSRHYRFIDTPIGFRIREVSDGPEQVIHIFN